MKKTNSLFLVPVHRLHYVFGIPKGSVTSLEVMLYYIVSIRFYPIFIKNSKKHTMPENLSCNLT